MALDGIVIANVVYELRNVLIMAELIRLLSRER